MLHDNRDDRRDQDLRVNFAQTSRLSSRSPLIVPMLFATAILLAFGEPAKALTAPRPKNASWVRNGIDAFVVAALEEKMLAPAPPASKATRLRRADARPHRRPSHAGRVAAGTGSIPPATPTAKAFMPMRRAATSGALSRLRHRRLQP
jgi:hypothetical protein